MLKTQKFEIYRKKQIKEKKIKISKYRDDKNQRKEYTTESIIKKQFRNRRIKKNQEAVTDEVVYQDEYEYKVGQQTFQTKN